MPTYQVRCDDCGKVFDELVKIDERQKIKCKCGGGTTVRFVSLGLRTTMFGRENKPLVLEHMTEDAPFVQVTTKQQLREACKKHECISPILD